MITAKEARELSGMTAQEQVEEIYPLIKSAAKKGERSIRLDSSFWVNDAYSKTESYKEATKILCDNGFEVTFNYEELQFVDMYAVVKW